MIIQDKNKNTYRNNPESRGRFFDSFCPFQSLISAQVSLGRFLYRFSLNVVSYRFPFNWLSEAKIYKKLFSAKYLAMKMNQRTVPLIFREH